MQPLSLAARGPLHREHLGLPVRWRAAHVVVHGRQHRDRLLGDIHASEDLRGLGDARQALVQRVRRQVVEVEVDVILGALQSKNNRSAGGALGISPDTLWFPLPDMKPFDFL